MTTAAFLILFGKIWLGLGSAVALAFLTFGIDQIDEDARDTYVFRPLLIPGVLILWPLVLWRWYILATDSEKWARRYKPNRVAHRWIGYALPVAIVVIVATGLSVRQQWPADYEPQQIAAPAEANQ